MKKTNRYVYLWTIQQRVNGRWQDVFKAPSRRVARDKLNDLLEGGGQYRRLQQPKREENPEYKELKP